MHKALIVGHDLLAAFSRLVLLRNYEHDDE